MSIFPGFVALNPSNMISIDYCNPLSPKEYEVVRSSLILGYALMGGPPISIIPTILSVEKRLKYLQRT